MRPAERRPLLVVLRPLGLGDLLTAVPALRALRRGFPGHEIVLAAPRELEPLALASHAVDRVVDTKPLQELAPELHGADIAVDLHGKGPQSHRVLLAARPARLLAFANAEIPESAGMPRWRAREHEVERWCRMLSYFGMPADSTDLHIERPHATVPAYAVAATLIHPGAGSEARCWPVDRFAEVARREEAAGRRVVVTGSPPELQRAKRLAELAALPRQALLVGETDLSELAALVGAAARVVSGDTGVAHLATALQVPSVTLFGPTSPARWGPPRSDPRHLALWAGREGDPHGDLPDRGLLAIRPEHVLGALDLLDQGAAAA